MIEPFQRKEVPGIGPEGYFIPEANPDAQWFFNEPSIATREYKGRLLRHTPRGWEYYQNYKVFYDFPGDPQQITGHQPSGWYPIYPKVSYFRQILQVLGNTWGDRNSSYKYVQQFEDAESPFTDEYELGEYWLVKDNPWYLVPVNKAEQISNINDLELYSMESVTEVFYALRAALEPMRDFIHGVIFTSANGRRAVVRPGDFDWNLMNVDS